MAQRGAIRRLYGNPARWARVSVFWWIALLCMFGWVSNLREAQYPLVFGALLALHVVLHWIMLYRSVPPRWWLAYFAAQGVLVLGIGLTQPYVSLTLGLFAILAGQATAHGLSLRQLGGLITSYVLLMTLAISIVEGWGQAILAPVWASTLFVTVAVVVMLYRRQEQARDHAEAVVAELQEAHEQLRAYAERVEDLTLVAERQRMARELHDTLAQGLAGLILQLEAVEAHLQNGRTARAEEIVQHAMVRARTALANSRRTIDNLRSDEPIVDDFGAALREEVARFSAASALACQLDLPELPSLSPSVHEHALRIVTECLTNVVRHAQATQVWVRVVPEDDMVALEIRDDGIGFDPMTITQRRGHYGLVGMNERVQLTGGTLDITSQPGAGTTVRARLPLSAGGAA